MVPGRAVAQMHLTERSRRVRDKVGPGQPADTLAHLLDLSVVSEGVETEQQYRVLAALGSDFCPGSYFGRPDGATMLNRFAATPT